MKQANCETENNFRLECFARLIASWPKTKRDHFMGRLKKRHGEEFRSKMYGLTEIEFRKKPHRG